MPGGRHSLLGFAVVALAATVGSCGDEEETTTATTTTTTTTTAGSTGAAGPGECPPGGEGDAFVDRASGEFEGLELDCREGADPGVVNRPDLEDAADAAGCRLQLDLPDEGNTHIPASKTPRYETSPPTSGDHDAIPLADGAYLDAPEARFFVHSLEHGRVVIHYQPGLSEQEQLALKGVFDEDPDGMILMPNPEMPYEVAATAWGNLLGCDAFNVASLDAIRAFRDEFRGKGPERIPL